MTMHQTADMIYQTDKLVFFIFYCLELLEIDWGTHFLTVNYISVATVTSVVESFQMDYQKFGSPVKLHCFVC